MATYYSNQYSPKGGISVASLPAGFVHSVAGVFTITTALAQNDVVKMLRLPGGSTVVGGYIRANDIDTGTEALDIDVGWAANGVDNADEDGFGNLGVWTGDAITDLRPEAGNYFPLGGVLNSAGAKTFTVPTDIQLDVNAAANAGGTGIITLVVDYIVANDTP